MNLFKNRRLYVAFIFVVIYCFSIFTPAISGVNESIFAYRDTEDSTFEVLSKDSFDCFIKNIGDLKDEDFVDLIIELKTLSISEAVLNKKSDIKPANGSIQLLNTLSFTQEDLKTKAKNILKNENNPVNTEVKISHQKFIDDLISNISEFKIKREFSLLFNGFSLEIKKKEIQKLFSIKEIKTFYSLYSYNLPDIYPTFFKISYKEMKNKNINPINFLVSLNEKDEPFNKLSLGDEFAGEGIKIGIIDTGIDYDHPDLGGPGFPNEKIIGGYNFAYRDNDPKDTNGHGTHVAGIAAADGKLKGTAQKAKLLAYKVFPDGSRSAASSDDIIASVERAIIDGCDIVNLSLGSRNGKSQDARDPQTTVINRAYELGLLIVSAAGNQGARSNGFKTPIDSPAAAYGAIAVAASDIPSQMAEFFDLEDGKTFFKSTLYLAIQSPSFPIQDFNLVYAKDGKLSDFNSIDVKGKIAVIKRNGADFSSIFLNALRFKANGVIVVNSGYGMFSQDAGFEYTEKIGGETIPFSLISKDDGEKLLSLMGNETGSIKPSYKIGIRFIENKKYSLMAPFSSGGPTQDFYFKPDISAPGVDILSTYIHNSYVSNSGTSMASPYIAGILAVIKNHFPKLNNKEIKSLLFNNATVLLNYENNFPLSFLSQGRGRVDSKKAKNAKIIVEPTAILIDKIPENVGNSKKINFSIKNISSLPLELKLSFCFVEKPLEGINFDGLNETFSLEAFKEKNIEISFYSLNDIKTSHFEGFFLIKDLMFSRDLAHIPFVYLNKTLENLNFASEFCFSQQEFSPNQDLIDDTIDFQFRLNYGSFFQGGGNALSNSQILDRVEVNIEDSFGKTIKKIYEKDGIIGGFFVFSWDGEKDDLKFIKSEGIYYVDISIFKADSFSKSKVRIFNGEYLFYARNLRISSFLLFLKNPLLETSSPKKKIQEGSEIDISLSFKNLEPFDNFSGEIFINPEFFSFITFSYINTSDFEITYEFLKEKNIIFVQAKKIKDNKENTYEILRFKLLPIASFDEEILRFNVSKLVYQGKELEKISIPLTLLSLPYPYIYDLNYDMKVDDLDLEIIKKHFGYKEGDAEYFKKVDFNLDKIIDGKDLLEFSCQFGETYFTSLTDLNF